MEWNDEQMDAIFRLMIQNKHTNIWHLNLLLFNHKERIAS